jgi:GNAT superfamily N-acetyltransferase
LQIQPGTVDPNLLVHLDHPNGEMRLTYARLGEAGVSAIAIFIPADSLDGLPVFQIGYAVARHHRRRGIGKEIAQAAVNEFTAGMARRGVVHFYLETFVGVKNIGSQKIAAHVIGGEPKDVEDHDSGEAVLAYLKEIGSGENRLMKR